MKPKLLAVVCLALAAAPALRAQTQGVETATAAASPAVAEAEAVQRRLGRARALAAIGRLAAAATELESLRATSGDDAVRDVARLLLMSIFVEMPDYPRAAALLDEAFKARSGGRPGDAASHAYFALAGQTVIAVRTHLDRYRNFGVNVADPSELPAEAGTDLDQLRILLERVITQAREIRGEQPNAKDTGALDATALLEDAATVRMRVPRHEQDRTRWQTEVSEARQHLLASETRIASISSLPPARPTPAPAAATSANKAPAQKTEPQRAGKQGQPPAAQPTPVTTAASTTTPSPATEQPADKGLANVIAVGSLVAKARQRVSPSYPAIARAARASGTVTVFLVVDEKGEVVSVERADGPLQLRTAATDAARRWKFNPTVVNGEPVRVSGYLSFNFAP
ncbi:MAG TPA: TonB family protein [Pyrinomonadaceae bacterium]|nr:TonB family protein [Pyrinomonadaceae bacterium]